MSSAAGWLPFLHELADRADALSTRYFRSRALKVDAKPDRSLVTQADLEVEATLRKLTAERFPDLGFYGEEEGEDGVDAPRRLIVDPIDGTANFARGLPIYATLLAVEDEGEIVAGLVSAPALHRRWHAARGHGAFAGEQRIEVSSVRNLADAQIFHGSLAGSETVERTAKLPGLLAQSWRQRGIGDFWQHVLVAEGCGEIACDVGGVKAWDVAPLQLLVEEAGGKATTVDGARDIRGGSLISSNGVLHERALAELAP